MKRRNILKAAVAGVVTPPVMHCADDTLAAPLITAPHVEVSWLGGATMVIRFDNLTLLTDPAFGEGDEAFLMGDPNEMFDLEKGPNVKHHKRITPFPGIRTADVDHLILSHLHEDHFDQKAEAELRKGLPIVVPVADAARLRSKGFTAGQAIDWGGKTTIHGRKGIVTITAVPTDHSEDPQVAGLLGRGNGYWLEFMQGDWRKTFYWTGDTFPTDRVMTTLMTLGRPDVLLPHLGGVGTTGALGQISMSARHVLAMADQLKPEKLMPLHHSTYAFYLEPVTQLSVEHHQRPYGLDLVSEGTRLIYD